MMDVFLLTSFSEGTAMTLLEAMAAGLPCVATNVGGNPEIIRNGKTGFVIKIEDDNSLAEKISVLFKSEELRQEMGSAARARFRNDFTVDKMVQSYQDIYEQANGPNYY
jgi:glycosyltransferase involved in cell wall biosynthesis